MSDRFITNTVQTVALQIKKYFQANLHVSLPCLLDGRGQLNVICVTKAFGEPHSELYTLTLDALQIPKRLLFFPLCWARGKLGNEKPFFLENVLSNCAVKAQVSVLDYRLLDCEMNFQALILLVMMPPSGVGRTVGCEMVGPSGWMGLETREHVSAALGGWYLPLPMFSLFYLPSHSLTQQKFPGQQTLYTQLPPSCFQLLAAVKEGVFGFNLFF